MNSMDTGSNMKHLFLTVYTTAEIQEKRAAIAQRLTAGSSNIKDQTITRIAPSDLKRLFDLYNEIFFENSFMQIFHGKMKFSLSRRLTRSAGKTLCPKKIGQIKPEDVVIEIRMGVDFFFDYDEVAGVKQVNGLPSRNALEAFQLVFEHELCHVIEFINFHSSNCNRKRFKDIAKSLFGHLESYHQLPTRQRIIREKMGLKIGDPVSFMYGKQRLQGVLAKINKRATVMVRDQNGNYADREGIRYRKFLVPVEFLSV
jgi:hypothetical protein